MEENQNNIIENKCEKEKMREKLDNKYKEDLELLERGYNIKREYYFEKLRNIVDKGEELVVGAAAHDKVIAKFCLNKSIGGFEFLFGIPGSIGGAISMNAGCYGFETKDIIN